MRGSLQDSWGKSEQLKRLLSSNPRDGKFGYPVKALTGAADTSLPLCGGSSRAVFFVAVSVCHRHLASVLEPEPFGGQVPNWHRPEARGTRVVGISPIITSPRGTVDLRTLVRQTASLP